MDANAVCGFNKKKRTGKRIQRARQFVYIMPRTKIMSFNFKKAIFAAYQFGIGYKAL